MRPTWFLIRAQMSTPVIWYLPSFGEEQVVVWSHLGIQYNYRYYTRGNLSAATVQTGGFEA